jgi:hypothetical protein
VQQQPQLEAGNGNSLADGQRFLLAGGQGGDFLSRPRETLMSVAIEHAEDAVVAACFPTFSQRAFHYANRRGTLGILGDDDLRARQAVVGARCIEILLLGFAFADDERDRTWGLVAGPAVE